MEIVIQDKYLRVFGNASDPYFCAIDICEILNITDFEFALCNMVHQNHITEVKSLNIYNGFDAPEELKSLDCSDNGSLVVLSELGVYDLMNGIKEVKNIKIINDIHSVIYSIKYKNNIGLINILTFISKFDLTLDINSGWFQDLWYPLSKFQYSKIQLNNGEKRPIIITQNLLNWMGYKGRNVSDKQERFVRFLESLKISYTKIDYKHPLAIEYQCIQKEILTIPNNNIKKKRWICMDPRDFKKVIIRLNTKNSDIIRDYFLNLEEALFAYGEYTKNYIINREEKEKQLVTLVNEDLKLRIEKVERKAIRASKLMKQVTIQKQKLEWIYIATTNIYAKERIFKIGSTTRLNSRISGYNIGRPSDDSYYYCWVKQCYHSKDLDYHIQKLLTDFKYRENTELYHGIKFLDLKVIVDFIIDNYDKSIDYINIFVNTRLNESLEEEDEEPPRLNYKETMDMETQDSRVIREELDNILCSFKEQYKNSLDIMIGRKELIDRLGKVTNLGKKELWSQIKEYTGWINSKSEIVIGAFKYKIVY